MGPKCQPAWQGSITLATVSRLNDPVYRRRAQQFAADAFLAAAAFGMAFVLRFLDVPIGIPHRYLTMLAGSVAFVAIGKAIIFEALGLSRAESWLRSSRSPSPTPTTCPDRWSYSTSC